MDMPVPVGIVAGIYPCKRGDIEAHMDKQQEQGNHNTRQAAARMASPKMLKNSAKTVKYQ